MPDPHQLSLPSSVGVHVLAVLRVRFTADIVGAAPLAEHALRAPLAAQLPGRLWGAPLL